jgi:hypothetical protein
MSVRVSVGVEAHCLLHFLLYNNLWYGYCYITITNGLHPFFTTFFADHPFGKKTPHGFL